MGRFPAAALIGACALMSTMRPAWGQADDLSDPMRPPITMTLPEARAYARAHQPLIRAGLARVNARVEEARIPGGQWLPRVGVTAQGLGATSNNTTAGYLTSDAVPIPRIGGSSAAGTADGKPYASTFVGAGIRQEAFDFGRISAQRAAADALVEVERQQASVAILDVDFAVEEAFFAVFAAKGVLKASEDAYARARVHRDLAKAGVGSGLRSPIELTRAEAELARYEIGRIRAAGGAAIARSVLAAAVGAPEAMVDVAGDSPRPADMPSLAEAMRQAAKRDPRVLQSLARIKAEEERARAIGAELRPNLSLTATVSSRAGGSPPSTVTGDGFLPYVPNYDVGLVLEWPIFDGVVLARRDAARSSEQVAREDLDVVRNHQSAAIERTYESFSVAKRALPGLEQAVTAARANYDQADARFRAGLGTAVELADAEDLRASAEINFALGQFDAAQARAAFGRAIAEGL